MGAGGIGRNLKRPGEQKVGIGGGGGGHVPKDSVYCRLSVQAAASCSGQGLSDLEKSPCHMMTVSLSFSLNRSGRQSQLWLAVPDLRGFFERKMDFESLKFLCLRVAIMLPCQPFEAKSQI